MMVGINHQDLQRRLLTVVMYEINYGGQEKTVIKILQKLLVDVQNVKCAVIHGMVNIGKDHLVYGVPNQLNVDVQNVFRVIMQMSENIKMPLEFK